MAAARGLDRVPNDILRVVPPAFDDLFALDTPYRATGVILCKLSEAYYGQLDLFSEVMMWIFGRR
jgi:hypothetical protein